MALCRAIYLCQRSRRCDICFSILDYCENIHRLQSIWCQSSLIPGVVSLLGDSVNLVCPSGLVDPMYWTLGYPSSFRHSQIANYTTSQVPSVNVEEPWESRGWTVDITNGGLVIPEVTVSDEDVYYCGGNINPSPVSLWVVRSSRGEFSNLHD